MANNDDQLVLVNGEPINRDRFAHGAGVPSEKNRSHYASHPRYRSLTNRKEAS
jgi:hypothetical protein